MVSFRSARAQASHALARASAIGESRHAAKSAGSAGGRIFSLGTQRAYTQAMTQAAEWYVGQAKAGREGFDLHVKAMTLDQAREYLELRGAQVGQKQVDLDRQALQTALAIKLDRLKSTAEKANRLATQPRAYTPAQVAAIAAHQTAPNQLATLIATAAGLRGHELATIRPAAEQPASTHRDWRNDRFAGRIDHAIYTVAGKGGLVREVAIPADLAHRLEQCRLAEPRTVIDRGIRYQQHYAISYGQKWSQSVTTASKAALGWSVGAHGLRHSYAQERVEELQQGGFSWHDARSVASQEMGHFREDVTSTYLR